MENPTVVLTNLAISLLTRSRAIGICSPSGKTGGSETPPLRQNGCGRRGLAHHERGPALRAEEIQYFSETARRIAAILLLGMGAGIKGGQTVLRQMTAIIERDGDFFVALCPELDIASQGASVSEARANLKEALELFYEAASADEIQRWLHDEIYVTQVEVAVG